MSHALEVIGIIAAALLAGGAIVATSVRARAAAALGALALAPALLIADIWHSPQLASLRDRPAAAVGAACEVLGTARSQNREEQLPFRFRATAKRVPTSARTSPHPE